jgi:hypothetical protein
MHTVFFFFLFSHFLVFFHGLVNNFTEKKYNQTKQEDKCFRGNRDAIKKNDKKSKQNFGKGYTVYAYYTFKKIQIIFFTKKLKIIKINEPIIKIRK